MKQIYQSIIALPLWVNLWIWLFLVPINAATFLFLETSTGFFGALAASFVVVVNCTLIWLNKGMSKVLAIPHLIAWVPLVLYIAVWMISGEAFSTQGEFVLALALLIANGISLGFDVYDTNDWLKGNRAVTGFPDAPVRF